MSPSNQSWDHPEVRELISLALREDIGDGDITSETCIPADRMASGRFFAREDAVLAGVEILPMLFERRGGVASVELFRTSGDVVGAGVAVTAVRGRARTLLECERT